MEESAGEFSVHLQVARLWMERWLKMGINSLVNRLWKATVKYYTDQIRNGRGKGEGGARDESADCLCLLRSSAKAWHHNKPCVQLICAEERRSTS